MSEVTDKLIGNCFENLEKAEVLGRLLYAKFFGEKDTDISLEMLISFIKAGKDSLIKIQEILNRKNISKVP